MGTEDTMISFTELDRSSSSGTLFALLSVLFVGLFAVCWDVGSVDHNGDSFICSGPKALGPKEYWVTR